MTRPAVVAYTALLAIAALLAAVGAQAQPHDRTTSARVCFPARSWDANPNDRPCVVAHAPQEDGSVRIVQRTAASTPRRAAAVAAVSAVCILPNPNEETGTYTARCYRKKEQAR